jgi:Ca-activated chloride channel family protein
LQEHPNTRAADKIHFGAGAAAYKMKDYGKALQSFSQALLSPDRQLQSLSHYNLGNTLYQRGETQKANDKKLADWQNALQHYEQTLKIAPENKEAKENAEFVKQKIEELKQQQEQQPTPSPSPNQQAKKDQKNKDQQQQNQDQKQDQQQQQQDQSGSGDNKKPEDGEQSDQQQEQKPGEENKPGQTPSPSPGTQAGGSPSPSPGQAGASPTPGGETGASPTPGDEDSAPSPSPGEGDADGEGGDADQPPKATPSGTPPKKLEGDVKGASEDQTGEAGEAGAPAEAINEAQMSPQQAERLLRAMRDEEQRVQLDERRASRRVYNDW